MKSLVEFINESNKQFVEFQGQQFVMNEFYGQDTHANLRFAAEVDSFTDQMWKDLKRQGVKYIMCIPPHYTPGNIPLDKFSITMFCNKKKFFNQYKGSAKTAVYDVSTKKCINKAELENGGAYKEPYKIIRFE